MRRLKSCALVSVVQTCALPISLGRSFPGLPPQAGTAAPHWTETMQALKALVIVMGVLIVVGTTVVVVTIYNRMQTLGETAPEPAAAPAPAVASSPTPAEIGRASCRERVCKYV